MDEFLGFWPRIDRSDTKHKNDKYNEYPNRIFFLPHILPRRLFYSIIYLAPGDYHRIHSPVNWVVNERIHFAG